MFTKYFQPGNTTKAEELDRVLQGRLPEYDDLKDLPYGTDLV